MRYLDFLLLNCLLIGFMGCTATKKTILKEYAVQTDSISYDRKDSLFFNRLLQSNLQQTIRLEHLTLSKPDSVGLQYVETVTLALTETQQKLADEEILIGQSYRSIDEKSVAILEKQEKETKYNYIKWILFMFAVFAFILFVIK